MKIYHDFNFVLFVVTINLFAKFSKLEFFHQTIQSASVPTGPGNPPGIARCGGDGAPPYEDHLSHQPSNFLKGRYRRFFLHHAHEGHEFEITMKFFVLHDLHGENPAFYEAVVQA